MARDILVFIIDKRSLMFAIIVAGIIVYSWVSMIIHKDYKFIKDYSRKYGNRILTSNDIKNIRYEIKHMDGRDFEFFCEWLFKKTGNYKSIILTSAENDQGRDLILVDENDTTIFVECKRYTNNATVTENFMIGREICQKLIGAMVAENIKNGIIVTTGNIHQNAWNYINKLEKNTDIRIEIIELNDIMRMIDEINTSEVLDVVGLKY